MGVFGTQWDHHWEKVERNWRHLVGPEDVVLLPGDHSWGMHLEDAHADLEWLCSLPGRKVLSRGNHDYWWQSIGRLRQAWPQLTFLQNDAAVFGRVGVCGTRGWNLPGSEGASEAQDEKIYLRELERLRLALKALPRSVETRVAMLHYPPLLPHHLKTGFTDLLEEHGIDLCVYGHLHRPQRSRPYQGVRNGVRYLLLSCDFQDFSPVSLEVEG